MNKEQYDKVCEACDKVLLSCSSSFERVAIAWLHVIREHPVFLLSYKDITESRKKFKNVEIYLKNTIMLLVSFYKGLIHNIFNNKKSTSLEEDSSKIDVLIVSHLLNDSQYDKNDDFYFGDLPEKLTCQNKRAIIALINHTGINPDKFYTKKTVHTVKKYIFPDFISFGIELKFIFRFLREQYRLLKEAICLNDSFLKKVYIRAAVECLSPSSLNSFRMAYQVKQLVNKYKPEVLLTTYEGHAWERACYAAARESKPDITCAGYQHATLFQHQHAIFRLLGAQFDPDIVFASGKLSLERFGDVFKNTGVEIKLLGSNRVYIKSDKQNNKKIKNKKVGNSPVCLVLPEGIISECELLFKFSIECAIKNPDIDFIWRLHPILSFDKIFKNKSIIKSLPENITLSEQTLEQDLEESIWALYRGTTAIIPATCSGVKPIYYRIPSELDIDPMYDLEGLRESVQSVSEFSEIINSDKRNYTFENDYKLIIKNLDQIYTPFNYSELINLL